MSLRILLTTTTHHLLTPQFPPITRDPRLLTHDRLLSSMFHLPHLNLYNHLIIIILFLHLFTTIQSSRNSKIQTNNLHQHYRSSNRTFSPYDNKIRISNDSSIILLFLQHITILILPSLLHQSLVTLFLPLSNDPISIPLL